jgi:hypothetical protein
VGILEDYSKQIDEELKIDEFNIKEASMKAPARKHYWVSRLIFHKKNLLKLEQDKILTIKTVSKQIMERSPVNLTQQTVEKTAQNHENIKKFDYQIKEEKNIIEFLEKVEKIYTSITYDIKNIIEVIKLEQL